MIAFGSAITMPDVYERCARAGIARAAEPDSPVFAHAAAGSVARSYNLILDEAARLDGLEALVLLHQDAEIVDPGFCARVREGLADPEVGVVGAVGAVGVNGIAWWEGSVSWSGCVYRYGEMGGGELVPGPFAGAPPPLPSAPGALDSLHGSVLVLSPWAVRTLRFDESIGLRHGYDFDLCRQVQAAGRSVRVADLRVVHHHSLNLIAEPEAWAAAHVRAAEKWDPGAGDEDEAWKERARRAEADAAGARLMAASWLLLAYATAQSHDDGLEAVTASRSWKATQPLRRLNARIAARRGG